MADFWLLVAEARGKFPMAIVVSYCINTTNIGCIRYSRRAGLRVLKENELASSPLIQRDPHFNTKTFFKNKSEPVSYTVNFTSVRLCIKRKVPLYSTISFKLSLFQKVQCLIVLKCFSLNAGSPFCTKPIFNRYSTTARRL